MDNDQRNRRDGPEPDGTAEEETDVGEASRPAGERPDPGASPYEPPIESTAESEPSAGLDPVAPEASAIEPSPSAAEIESWPSQDASAASQGSEPASEPADERAWPTEPPVAGSGSTETWPTIPPERGAEPIAGPVDDGAQPIEPPPAADPPLSEVEAYPAATTSDPDTSPMADAGATATAAHSVPEAEGSTGESTQCPRCGTENRPGLAFCRECGQRLVAAGVSTTVERPGTPEGTMACPRCGTHNRAGVAFCQNCGANLRGTGVDYVPPAVVGEGEAVAIEAERRGAVLGPVVLIIGVVGLITGYLLPFLYGDGSLFERGFGADGYGAAFWSGYPDVGAGLADQVYFGLAAPVPLFALLIGFLAVGGFMRARPGVLQTVGLAISLLWSVGLVVGFVVVELAGNWDGDLVGVLRVLTPAGIIFLLSSLIMLIGTLTRFGRS